MFIPYRAKIKLTRIPWATIAIMLVCLLVYWGQARNEARVVDYAKAFCAPPIAAEIERAQKEYVHSDSPCWRVLGHTYAHANPEKHLQEHVEWITKAGDTEAAETLVARYREFAAQAPVYRTAQLWKHSESWNPWRMLTSTLSHGSWDHVIGNLFFFFAFAMVVEMVIGPVLMVLVFLGMAFGIGALETMLIADREGDVGLGLSGVVTGMMTLAAYFAPRIKIKYFYFFFLYIGVLSIPIWAVSLWYVGWDLLDYVYNRAWSNINYAAHLLGAVMGLLLGVTVFRHKRHWAEGHLIPDERAYNEDETWLYKFNVLGSIPIVMLFGLAGFFVALTLIIEFISTFAVQILLTAPMIAAGIQIYRMQRPHRPAWERYQEAMGLVGLQRHAEAFHKLKPLAEEGYPRAQYQLGRLYANGHGTHKDPRTAAHWYAQAAEREDPHAQHALAACYIDGRGVGVDFNQALAWYTKAATKLPVAAMAMGYHNQYPRDKDPLSRERAADWYAQAVRHYLRDGAREDAAAALTALVSVEPVSARTAELTELVAAPSLR